MIDTSQKLVYVSCKCGRHAVEVNKLRSDGISFYQCDDCRVPLVICGEDGAIYLIGQKVFK